MQKCGSYHCGNFIHIAADSLAFGGKVDLKRDEKGKGQIVVKFDNDAELNRLIDLMEGK